jgi:hypothetical protein
VRPGDVELLGREASEERVEPRVGLAQESDDLARLPGRDLVHPVRAGLARLRLHRLAAQPRLDIARVRLDLPRDVRSQRPHEPRRTVRRQVPLVSVEGFQVGHEAVAFQGMQPQSVTDACEVCHRWSLPGFGGRMQACSAFGRTVR